MKRLHVHVAVENLAEGVRFYTGLFGCEPTKLKADYAKWMLDDPRVNFAISARGAAPGLDHLGIQTETGEELDKLRQGIDAAGLTATGEGETTCCYAQSDKSWLQDPTGIAWEVYHTMAEAELFSQRTGDSASACCVPPVRTSHEAPAAAGEGLVGIGSKLGGDSKSGCGK